MQKITLPSRNEIAKVLLLNGRILVTLSSGQELSFSYEKLTVEQENFLRELAGPMKQRRVVKPVRELGKAKKSVNYAELTTKRILL